MSRRARLTDPHTSWAATYVQTDQDVRLRAVIYAALKTFGPLTHDDLIRLVCRVRLASDSGVRTRTRELVDEGKVEAVPDMVAKSRYGRSSLLWRVVSHGPTA